MLRRLRNWLVRHTVCLFGHAFETKYVLRNSGVLNTVTGPVEVCNRCGSRRLPYRDTDLNASGTTSISGISVSSPDYEITPNSTEGGD